MMNFRKYTLTTQVSQLLVYQSPACFTDPLKIIDGTAQSHDLGFDKEDLDLFGFTLSAEEMKALDAAKLPPIEI